MTEHAHQLNRNGKCKAVPVQDMKAYAGVQKQLHSFLKSALDWVSRDRSVCTTVGLDDYHRTDMFHTPTGNPATIPWGKQTIDQLLPLLCYSQSRPNKKYLVRG